MVHIAELELESKFICCYVLRTHPQGPLGPFIHSERQPAWLHLLLLANDDGLYTSAPIAGPPQLAAMDDFKDASTFFPAPLSDFDTYSSLRFRPRAALSGSGDGDGDGDGPATESDTLHIDLESFAG